MVTASQQASKDLEEVEDRALWVLTVHQVSEAVTVELELHLRSPAQLLREPEEAVAVLSQELLELELMEAVMAEGQALQADLEQPIQGPEVEDQDLEQVHTQVELEVPESLLSDINSNEGTNMAHYAEVIDGKVTRVLVIDNEWSQQETFDFLMAVSQHTWVQASYNSRIRGHYPAIGDTYNEELDIFVESVFPEGWVLNVQTGFYEEPPLQPVYISANLVGASI